MPPCYRHTSRRAIPASLSKASPELHLLPMTQPAPRASPSGRSCTLSHAPLPRSRGGCDCLFPPPISAPNLHAALLCFALLCFSACSLHVIPNLPRMQRVPSLYPIMSRPKPLLYLCHARLRLFLVHLRGLASVHPATVSGGMRWSAVS
jgi:hypothetical protein